jgi:hypothetical protein
LSNPLHLTKETTKKQRIQKQVFPYSFLFLLTGPQESFTN